MVCCQTNFKGLAVVEEMGIPLIVFQLKEVFVTLLKLIK